MAKLLFLNPPSLTSENVVRDSIYGCWCKGKRIGGAMTPPYPQLELATLMQAQGHEVRVVDASVKGLNLPDVEAIVKNYDYTVILTSVMTFSEDIVVLEKLKKASPRTIIIIYGSLPTFLPEMALKRACIDVIIRREAEYVLRDFVQLHCAGDAKWQDVKGLGFRREDGSHVVNDFYPFIENLDELPFVNWSLLENPDRYFNPTIKRTPYVTELVTRGCPWKCTFCMSPGFYGRKVRTRSPENILKAVEQHVANGIKEIYFRDELFTAFTKNVRAFCQGIIDRKLDLTWICSVRAGTISYDDLKLMKEAGCHLIKVGVESGSQVILDGVKKGITIEQVVELFDWARRLGVDTHAHCMVGFPGETPETIQQTIKHVIRLRPTTATFALLTPYPGTTLFDEVVAKKYPHLKTDYSLKLENLHTTSFYSDAYCEMSAAELSEWVMRAHKVFFLRPSYILQTVLRMRSLSDFFKITKAGLKIIGFTIYGEK